MPLGEKGRLSLPHVFWQAFPGQKAAFSFLRAENLEFSTRNYAEAEQDLFNKYSPNQLAELIVKHIKSRLYPDDINDLWRLFWEEKLPELRQLERADAKGYQNWVEIEWRQYGSREIKDWFRFGHFYFQYLGDKPPSGSTRKPQAH